MRLAIASVQIRRQRNVVGDVVLRDGVLQCNDVLFLGAQQRREGVFERAISWSIGTRAGDECGCAAALVMQIGCAGIDTNAGTVSTSTSRYFAPHPSIAKH